MAQSEKQNKAPDILNTIDEVIALVPGTDVEISVLERYGGNEWKARMLTVREKLTNLRAQLIDAKS